MTPVGVGVDVEQPQKFFELSAADPTGATAIVVEWIPRYRTAAQQRHAAFMSNWAAKDFDAALVELHFFLTAACRIVDFMAMTADRLQGGVKSHVDSRDFGVLKDARNHFEHIEDRLFGSKRNSPQPVVEGGASRRLHFGLRASEHHVRFGDKALDVSSTFLRDFLSFVDRFLELTEAVGKVAAPIGQARSS